MFAGLVENLGLKEGLQEFRDQFKQDAKATVAETQWAQDRGIDVAKLDAMEQTLADKAADVHDHTIGRVVETLAQDETIAQLLELKAKEEGDDDEYAEDELSPTSEEAPHRSGEQTRLGASPHEAGDTAHALPEHAAGAAQPGLPEAADPVASEADVAASPPQEVGHVPEGPVTNGMGLAECASPASEEPSPRDVTAHHVVSAASTAAPTTAASPPSVVNGVEPSPWAVVGSPAATTVAAVAALAAPKAASAPSAVSEKLRQLENDLRERKKAKAALEAQMAAAREQGAGLESRWKELAAVSQDAAKNSAEANQHIDSLRATLAETDMKLAELIDTRERLEREIAAVKCRHSQLESAFQENLNRAISQKEQELLDEVAYLRRTQEAKEKKIQDMEAELARLERRCGGLSTAGGSQGKPVDPHIALSRAFGYDDSDEHPCLILLDHPLLMCSRYLLRGSCTRRLFYALTVVFWIGALGSALKPQHGGHIIHT